MLGVRSQKKHVRTANLIKIKKVYKLMTLLKHSRVTCPFLHLPLPALACLPHPFPLPMMKCCALLEAVARANIVNDNILSGQY